MIDLLAPLRELGMVLIWGSRHWVEPISTVAHLRTGCFTATEEASAAGKISVSGVALSCQAAHEPPRELPRQRADEAVISPYQSLILAGRLQK